MSVPETRTTVDLLPVVHRRIALVCRECGKPGVYDVGHVMVAPKLRRKKNDFSGIQFTGYFHCSCGSPGPWDPAEPAEFESLIESAKDKTEGVHQGVNQLFDGAQPQTLAMGEQYLRQKINENPTDALPYSRLGNLLRSCGQRQASVPWYRRAIELNPADLESRYHLFTYAREDRNLEERVRHGLQLVTHLLNGARAEKEELTEHLAYSVVECVIEERVFWRGVLAEGKAKEFPGTEEFVRKLVSAQHAEENLVHAAVDTLMGGAALESWSADEPEPTDLPAAKPNASLAALAAKEGLAGDKQLAVMLLANTDRKVWIEDRRKIMVWDGSRQALWEAPSMQALFRGRKPAPPDIEKYPLEYTIHFYYIEKQLLTLCDARGDLSDQEMEEIYSALLRRPDGRSLGVNHDFMWQVFAVWLGTNEISESDYEGVLSALVRSTRRWGLKPVSRFYLRYLRDTFR